MAFDLQVKFKVEGPDHVRTGYRPEVPSARIPKWSQATATLSGQLTQT